MMAERIWLDVPFAEKDEVKAAGARWDPAAHRWYAPRPGMAPLRQWAAATEVPALLPGEDRSFGQGLFVDLVPSSCWFTNLRSCVTPRDWERLRRMITSRADHRCEVCGATADREARRWLEAHERWTFDQATRTQALRRLICLCIDCHHVTHYGYASQVLGLENQVFAHLMKVTKMTPAQASEHVDAAFTLWGRRSGIIWTLDLSILTSAGITLTAPPTADERDRIAGTEWRDRGRGVPHGRSHGRGV